jgi:hypothetical protein
MSAINVTEGGQQPGQGCQERTSRTETSRKGTVRTGIARTRQPGQVSLDRNPPGKELTGQELPGQDSLDKSVRTGLPEKDSQYMTAGAIQAERDVRTGVRKG